MPKVANNVVNLNAKIEKALSDGKVDGTEANNLERLARDGGKITPDEAAALRALYEGHQGKFVPKAKARFDKLMVELPAPPPKPPSDLWQRMPFHVVSTSSYDRLPTLLGFLNRDPNVYSQFQSAMATEGLTLDDVMSLALNWNGNLNGNGNTDDVISGAEIIAGLRSRFGNDEQAWPPPLEIRRQRSSSQAACWCCSSSATATTAGLSPGNMRSTMRAKPPPIG